MANATYQSSKLRRAWEGQIFFYLSILCGFVMDIPALMRAPPLAVDNIVHWAGGSVPILEKFHYLDFLDTVFHDVTTGFAPSSYQIDEISWWQMLNFINDIGVVYLIWLLESSRPATRGTIVRFPVILATLAQLGGGGTIFPFYYFLYWIYCPPLHLQSSVDRRVDLNDAILLGPLTLILHTAPGMAMYVAPSFEMRHYWTWFWQLYTVRISLGYYILRTITTHIGQQSFGSTFKYHSTLRLTMSPFIAVSAATWIYTFSNAPFSISTIFLPHRIDSGVAGTFVGQIGRLLKFDQTFLMGSSFLWLVFVLWEAKNVQLFKLKNIMVLLFLLVMIGPGATLGVAWLWRETKLAQKKKESK